MYTAGISELDSQVDKLIAAERRRQREKIILIPSESFTPPAVREALASEFTSIYAEGYPRDAMRRLPPERLANIDEQLAHHRRYADWRFYRGTEFADLIESLAGRRAAECFATPEYPPERIHANVQPLSGAAANLAVYEAFVKPGETVMGLDLTEGGHLTHGSEFNITGKRYNIVSYAADPATGKLDYDKIMALAREHRPRLIIAGFTSYPWRPDWAAFRRIADEVGARLLADVAHTAGMVIGGVYPSPIGYADAVMFTTHKTLCGPRGAVILSTDPEVAALLDNAIFPGEQGGPHVNKFAAIAVALKLAQSEDFKALQRRIVENARVFASALQEEGLTLAYGGTDTHLLLVDLKQIESKTGYVMMGEIAARLLDLVGIVCNKNTIPGDHSAADAHGIRLGTPWATQRGMGKEEMRILARIIARVLTAIHPFSYIGLSGDLSRGKLPLSVLEGAREETAQLISRLDPRQGPKEEKARELANSWTILRLRQGRTTELLHEATTTDVLSLSPGERQRSLMFDEEGKLLSEVNIHRLEGEDYLVFVPADRGELIKSWLCGIADGYILFDKEDVFRKVQGPSVVEEISATDVPDFARSALSASLPHRGPGELIQDVLEIEPGLFALDKPYFVGQPLLDLSRRKGKKEKFSWTEPEGDLRHTPLYPEHERLGARLVPFAGWEMPVWYSSALEEHRAVREAAGLFDLGHMGVFEVEGEYAHTFLNSVTSNYADWLIPGESQYAYLLDPDGGGIDDIFVYRRASDRYLLVVNAVNERKDWEWLTGVNSGRYLIDNGVPFLCPSPGVTLRDLKSEQGVMDLALQGPLSERILIQVLEREAGLSVASLARTQFCEVETAGHSFIVARTGYTGEDVGYEIYADKKAAAWLWQRLLEVGTPMGLKPCGLAARDSTRTEAGLPLYGSELAGPHNIGPIEAGFGSYVKLHKPFFIGRDHCVGAVVEQKREIIRFEVTDSTARPFHPGAAVVDRNGGFLGRVTSCVSLGERQVGLVLLDRLGIMPGTRISIISPPRGRKEATKPIAELTKGDRVAISVPAQVIERFPEA
jgi:glycine hydroxymethyltransferase